MTLFVIRKGWLRYKIGKKYPLRIKSATGIISSKRESHVG